MAAHLNGGAVGVKSGLLCPGGKPTGNCGIGELLRPMAIFTDEKNGGPFMSMVMGAGDKCIEAFQAMRKPLRDQALQRAIDGGRRGNPR